MARWDDLPLELKRKIVDILADGALKFSDESPKNWRAEVHALKPALAEVCISSPGTA